MKIFKLALSLLASMIVFTCFSAQSQAKDFGVVDLSKVIDNYTEAQEVAADLKVKEAKLKEFVLEAQNKIKAAKTPVEQKNLEEKFGQEFNLKRSAYAKEQTEKWGNIEDKIYNAIESMYKEKKMEMVFNKQSVIVGGTDITEELIKNLNKDAEK